MRAGEERLARALSIALGSGQATRDLREAIAGYIAAAKAGGYSWQETAAAVNALMRQAAGSQIVTGDADALAQRILQWCEEEFGSDR